MLLYAATLAVPLVVLREVLVELQTVRELDPRGRATRAAADHIVRQIPR